MRHFKSLLALAAIALCAGLQAQTANVAVSNPNMDADAPSMLHGDAEAVYGFRFKQTGVNADLGTNLAPGQFLGLEYTYFGLSDSETDPVSTRINSKEKISILGGTYRYSFPLGRLSDDMGALPIRFYIGAGAGFSFVKLNTSVPSLGYYTSDKDNGAFGGQASTGVEWWITRNFGVKAGFRYIYLYHVQLYGQKGNIDTGAVEGGATFRF